MPIAGRHSKIHRFRITLNQPEEVAYWGRILDVTEDVLRQAMAAVGDNALNVREYLDRQRVAASS